MKYANKTLKGLKTPKEYIVKNLSQYINIITNPEFQNCMFRGEPCNYFDVVSSALREYKSTSWGEDPFPFYKSKEMFKREIWHRISDDERKSFLAFCQHHGLPTNLIDVSTTPLVALYFACQPSSVEHHKIDNTRGMVNVMSSAYIDITDIIDSLGDKNFLLEFINDDSDVFEKLFSKFIEYEKHNPVAFYHNFKDLNNDIHYFFKKTPFNKDDIFLAKRFYPYKEGEYKDNTIFFEALLKYSNESDFHSKILRKKDCHLHFHVLCYLVLLKQFLQNTLFYTETVFWLNCMPIFTYRPMLTFERARNQQSMFIYQTYLEFIEEVYQFKVVSRQRIWPEKIIVIENKEEILRQLDIIGINEKFIYNDFDSIANYIKKSII